ncbi:hypothetical protein D9757_000823 [Collybiopsis confluens]|uniref:Uncharacterized protein n=1 Tax=Collybiopsis confluens TaxID=2823264 RepID=A0A8H5I0E5_9AGAR|nr:hypothetical protein D9757_000823 [Collybiopsis confluens]
MARSERSTDSHHFYCARLVSLPFLASRSSLPSTPGSSMKSVYRLFLLWPTVFMVVTGAPTLFRKDVFIEERSDAHVTTDVELYDSKSIAERDLDLMISNYFAQTTRDFSGQHRDLAIRPRGDVDLHGRDGNAAKVQKAGDTLSKTGSAIGKAAKVADAIPEVGEIVGTALQVVSYLLDILGGVLKGIAAAERESAHAMDIRGEFTQAVVQKTLAKHPGWFVAMVKPDHYFYGQGDEKRDWSHDETQITTVRLVLDFLQPQTQLQALRIRKPEPTITTFTRVTSSSFCKGFLIDPFAARAGVFMNTGDGGFLNWAYAPGDIVGVGWQKHRIQFANGAPRNKPKGGKCSMHLYHYKAKSSKNPDPFTTVVAILKDQNGVVVGFNGNGNADAGFDVASQLPHPVHIKAGKSSDSLDFTYGTVDWNNNDKAHCNNGRFDNGISQKDCFFTCAF